MSRPAAVTPELYPFESHWLERNGLKQHYLDEGRGEPVVMVHGNPTWSFYYRDLIRALRDDHRVIVPDHIGCGLSDKPGDEAYEYSLKQRVDDFGALIDSLKLEGPLNLVVHDWGGMIGMAWAVKNPDKVSRLVILNTAAFHLPPSKAMPWQLSLARDSKLGAFLVRGFNAFSAGATRLAVEKPMSAAVRAAYTAPYDSWDNRIATLRFVQDIPLKPGDRGYDIISATATKLPTLADKPTLICWGMRDFVFDEKFLGEWRNYLPFAEVHEYPSAGHYVLEDAGERIIPLIKAFLARPLEAKKRPSLGSPAPMR